MIPYLLSISGAHSGCGKTSLAEFILKRTSIIWGAIKCTHSDLYASLTDNPAELKEDGKDTARLLDAGARNVIWIQSPPEDLDELLHMAFSRLSECEGILVEGNSPAFRSIPDGIVFVYGDDPAMVKPSGCLLAKMADYIVAPPEMLIKGKKNVYNKYSENDMIALCDDIETRIKLREKTSRE